MICPFLRTFCVTRCLRQRLKGQSLPIVSLHSSSLRYNEDRQVLIRPKHLKKAKVIEIWNGMSPRDVSLASGIPIDRVYETMQKYRISRDLGTLGDVKELISRLQLRFSVVAPPDERREETEDIDIDEIIRKTRIPDGSDYRVRPPIVTIMGHVDHGKTTLLDALRKSEIVKGEFGGITQHIGAFVVSLDGNVSRRKQGMIPSGKVQEVVTFLDTPGHAAFAAMRQRGANVTDMVILVVAAEDGVMEQTIESIKYAQNAGVQMIVALNKIDKVRSLPEAVERVTRELYAQGIILESDGGEVQLVKISALKGEGLQDVKDAIGALAETMNLQAPYDGGVVGSVIEVKVDPHLGKLATILVQKGCLQKGDLLLAGDMSFCRVRSIQDEFGKNVDKVPPGFPAQISGWKEAIPEVGEMVYQFESEKPVRDIMNLAKNLIATEKARLATEERHAETEISRKEWEKKLAEADNVGIPDWLLKVRTRKKHTKTYTDDPSEPFKVRVLIKADVVGSAEVLFNIIQSYPNDTQLVKLIPISQGVGILTEGDIEAAASFQNSIIYSFNVPIPPKIFNLAKEKGVKIKHFNVIYHLVDDLRRAISDKIPEQDVDEEVARAVVQKQFDVNSKNKKTLIAGCRCLKGPLIRNNVFFKLIRDNQVLASGLEIDIMKHEKDEVKEIAPNQECGLTFKNLPPEISFKPQDIISCYKIKKVKPETKWHPPGF